MQRACAAAECPAILCFSTLYGSKWVAIVVSSAWGALCKKFQYPLRVEVGCNHSSGADALKTLQVSVPSTGRSGLQAGKCALNLRVFTFQYPLRVEVGCNRHGLKHLPRTCYVSVPSTGRSGLQRSNTKPSSASTARFSTLYGSKWVAT